MELLVWFVVCFIATFGYTYLYYKLNDLEKMFNIKSSLVFLIGVIFSAYIQYYHIELIGNIAYFIFFPLIFYFMNSAPLKKIFYYVIMIWFYGMVLDLIAMLIVTLLNFFFTIDIYSSNFECILTTCLFIALVSVAQSKKLKLFTNNFYKKVFKVRFSDISLILFSLFTFLVGISIFINLSHLNINLILLLLLILIITIFVLLIKSKINEVENTLFLNKLKENNEFYMKIEEENSIFKHNLNAKLKSIKSVANEEARELLNELIYDNNKNGECVKHIKDIPYGFNGIIYETIYPYLNLLKIEVENTINYDIFKILKPRRYNVLVEKMVIAIDNAIEAAKNSLDKTLMINVYDKENEIIIEIRNTFSSSIDIDELGNKNYSTKGKKRGIGLYSALRNNIVNLDIKVINDYFVSKLSVNKISKLDEEIH